METITTKSLTLRMETSKGGVLEETFNNYAELFDFVTQRVMGCAEYDADAEEMIGHVGDQWTTRGEHGDPWGRKGFKYKS
jgi:hypothetical protein